MIRQMFARAARSLRGVMMKRMHSMITCAEFEEFIAAYLDGSLPKDQRSLFDRHIRFCPDCRRYLAGYQVTTELGKAVFDTPHAAVPEEVPEDLVAAVLRSRHDT